MTGERGSVVGTETAGEGTDPQHAVGIAKEANHHIVAQRIGIVGVMAKNGISFISPVVVH